MNEDIIDEIINDEVEKNTTQIEVPFGYGRLIVCKPTLVNNSKQLIHKIAVALHQALICDVKECDSKENNVFAILIEPMKKVRKTQMEGLQNALQGLIEKHLKTGGFVEIQIYRDVYIYKKEGRVEVDECIYKDTVSHEKPLKGDFVDILTRDYEPTPKKTIVEFPYLIF